MLSRTVSTPLLNSSRVGSSNSSLPEFKSIICLTNSGRNAPIRKLARTKSDSQVLMKSPLSPRHKPVVNNGLGLEFGLGEKSKEEEEVGRREKLAPGGGRGPDGRDGGPTDAYYQKLIEADPQNSLLLVNYARFLKEVGDHAKAEKYCGRGILANPDDGSALSLYADIIWQSQKDVSRAETYFDQAAKAAPNDCYVLASCAKFLWDAEDEEEGDSISESNAPIPTRCFQTVPPTPPPLTAAA